MSKSMSEQMQKLADRYEKATGKKFDVKTNAQKIRSMSDKELPEMLRIALEQTIAMESALEKEQSDGWML